MQAIEGSDGSPVALPATPLVLAAMLSAGAGLIHGAAAGSHSGDQTLAVLFALTAVAQLGWAAVAIARPSRGVAILGASMNLGFAVVWLLTRTVGFPLIGVLSVVESPGLQDTVAAALAMGAVSLALWSVANESGPELLHRSSVATVAAVLVMAVTVPAVAVGHEHDHDDETAPTETAAEVEAEADTRSDIDAESVAFVEELPEPHDHDLDGPIISLYDPRVTPDQREAARQLIEDTRVGMERFPDVESVEAAGYVSIGDGVTGFEHFINVRYTVDWFDLNPDRIESIVARVNPDGSREIVSAMYLMAPGNTMDDVPDIAGPLTTWHDHQDLCWEGVRVVGTTQNDGSCPRGEFRPTPPMLHVWLEPHPCGPFAGLEGHGGGCEHDH